MNIKKYTFVSFVIITTSIFVGILLQYLRPAPIAIDAISLANTQSVYINTTLVLNNNCKNVKKFKITPALSYKTPPTNKLFYVSQPAIYYTSLPSKYNLSIKVPNYNPLSTYSLGFSIYQNDETKPLATQKYVTNKAFTTLNVNCHY